MSTSWQTVHSYNMHFGRIGKLQVLLCILVVFRYGDAAQIYPQARMFGGASASEGQFPHQISLRWGGGHACGGSIISENYVVTAAHCVTIGSPPKVHPNSYLSIRAGSRLQDRGGQVIGVSEVKVHPSYDKANNDIALLKLANPLKFNDKIKPIALASQEPPTGVPVIASGWGHTYKGGSTPKVLQYNTFMALTNAECKRRRPSTTDSVICLAHAAGNGLCFGDSGGPAIYKNQLVGVANYMIDGCANTNPDGFASVAYHINWLRNNSN